jgi:formate dehydrogenase major subunit
MDTVTITINGKKYTANKNDYILDVAVRENIFIPTLCNDSRLKPYTSCYVCVVEIEGVKKPQPSCSTKVSDGMVVYTENEKVTKARQTALNLLLSDHYADCVAPCKETCPAGVDVQAYISLIEKGLYSEAVKVIKETNPLPAICGRVCVRPCEVACRRNLLDEGAAVGIDYMKRFAADYDLESDNKYIPEKAPSTGKKVAVIGAGPGGLTAAYYLQLKGHQADIYEANEHPGGWLRYGIPEYRLPNDLLDKEVKNITDLGVNIFYNKNLGDNLSYKELEENYDATILTIGSQRGTLIGVDGENAENVFSGIDYLRNMEQSGQRYDFKDKKVIVVGGGNTAMDCCRSALRCGSTDVKVVYRRTEKEMPANPIEIHESKLEGVEYLFLHNPVKVNQDENGKLKSVTLIKMELGEPDSSGRRRPVPIEGSEFDLEVDYILAAIGQKTDINFLEDINKYAKTGELKPNKWGDIDADSKTLQTGIPNVFAAGDGVTGPATLIEAVAQANTAVLSCHQYLMGEEIKPKQKPFISRKDNFVEQQQNDYLGRYQNQLREEMPVLPPEDRVNYKEVELGYENEDVVKHEAERCLECGCSEFHNCALQQYATIYEAQQQVYKGEFKKHEVDFSHPLIEIDNNKCILCAKCIRICGEVVGANALGLVERGFDTYVAPTMGNSLIESNCESCGMCVSICPTGAITENVPFKTLPVNYESIEIIDPFTSEGAKIELRHKGGFIFRAEGMQGSVNKNGSIGKHAKFGYRLFNDAKRITKPMMKKLGKWEEVSFEEAFETISAQLKGREDNSICFAGARLSNEELYLTQKFVRAALHVNHITSFHYLNRGEGYHYAAENNLRFDEIKNVKEIYLIGSDLNYQMPLVNHCIMNAKIMHGAKLRLITDKENAKMAYKCDEITPVKSYYAFVKAMNKIMLEKGLENKFFIDGQVQGFQAYKDAMQKESLQELSSQAGISVEQLQGITEQYNTEANAVFVFMEEEVSSNTAQEIMNLAMISGKLGKTAAGIIALKGKNNAQGLIDMGIKPILGVGACDFDSAFEERMQKHWKVEMPELSPKCQYDRIKSANFENILIFGEDPIGTAIDKDEVANWFKESSMIVVQDYFMTETAEMADIILPASFPFETGGSFTNTQKQIQNFEKLLQSKVEMSNIEQLASLCKQFELEQTDDIHEIQDEYMAMIAEVQKYKPVLRYTAEEIPQKYFKFGCDALHAKADELFS